MSEQLQLRRGTISQVAAFTGAQGELAVDTTNNILHVNDGATAGGWPLALATRAAVSDAPYSALVTDRIVAYTALTAARVVTLPAAGAYPVGAILAVIDESGAASATKTITLSRAGSDTIDGGTSAVISAANGVLAVESNGSNAWTIVHSRAPSTPRTPVSDAAYSALATDRLIAYTAITAARVVSLPTAAAYSTGALLVVIDESGACSPVKTIAATAVGSDTINGAASAVIASAYGSLTLESNGVAAWTIVDAFAPTYSEAVYVRALGVNLNALGDTQVAIPPPSAGITRYHVGTVYVENASTSLTTAKLGVYTAASQGGVAIVAQSALSSITTSAANTIGNEAQLTPSSTLSLNLSTLYINVGTAQGAAATADVVLQIIPLS